MLGTHALCCVFCVPVVCLFCFLPCWPFCCLLKRFYLQLDPDLCLHGDISHRPMTEFNQHTWVQRVSLLTSVRQMGVLRSMLGTSGRSLVGRRKRISASWSSSGEAWPSPSSPGCLTGSQRSCWRTPVREPMQSAPVREPMQSAPFREPTQSAPFREPTESALQSAPVREPTQSAPFREPTQSAQVQEPTE